MNTRNLLQWTFSVTLIAMLLSGNSRIDAQPQSGDWTAQTDFGEFVFTVNPTGTHINKLVITFVSFSCGGVTQSGTIITSTSPGWPISNNQFTIETSINPTGSISMTITGTFSVTGDQASGTWSLNVSGTICSGSWGPIPVSVKDVGDGIPERFLITQNYPNPFNPSTSIQYTVSSRQFVSLKIYDVLGNEIATLVNEEKPAGSYEVEFNSEGISSGIYLYKITAGDFTQTKKMILLK